MTVKLPSRWTVTLISFASHGSFGLAMKSAGAFFWPARDGIVQLPKILQARRVLQNVQRLRVAALAGPVVHDGHLGTQGMHQELRVRHLQTVMAHHEQVHGADEVLGAHEIVLDRRKQIREIEHAELAELIQQADRACVFAAVLVGRGDWAGPVRFGWPRAGQAASRCALPPAVTTVI